MSEHYDFHYQPTGSGAISGQQVLEQTEDAINELGDYVNDNVGGAMDVAQQALETAQTAETNAQTALDTANSFSSAIQSAQQDASTALSTAQTAQTTASNANNTAIQASQDANTAVTTANNASSQVSTLSGTVTALGQRVTTAEGNIGQNTSDITALGQRVTTAEGNITTLQNDVTIAQGNASSAMATAGQVKQQAFVFRYSSTALVASSTNSNALLDNTDNLKVGDKVIDSSGVLFSITAIDTQNSTFTIGTALVDLAQDSDVVHKSGNETVGGVKTFTDSINLKSNVAEYGVTGGNIQFYLMDKNNVGLSKINQGAYANGVSYITLQLYGKDSNNQTVTNSIVYQYSSNFNYSYLLPTDTSVFLGNTGNRWGKIYGIEYYYGSNNVEFSTKFVTTDTNQTISGVKTFSDDITRGNTTIASGIIKGNGNTPTIGLNGVGYLQSHAYLIYQDSTPTKSVKVTLEVQDSSYTDGKSSAYFPNSNNLTNLGKAGKRWANVYATNYYYGGSEVEFSTKFVTTDTDQAIAGNKTFSNFISSNGSYLGNEASTNQRTNICLRSNRDTANKSGAYITRFRQNRDQGALQPTDLQKIGFDVLENEVRTNNVFDIQCTDWLNDVPQRVNFVSSAQSYSFGYSTKKALINGVEPSSLSLPSGNVSDVIDISSYITALDGTSNSYTVPANGWISIAITGTAISIVSSSWSDSRLRESSGNVRMLYPVLKNETLGISVIGTTLDYARFIPCQGNV